MKNFCFLAAMVLALSLAQDSPARASNRTIDSAFIQFQGWMMGVPKATWEKDLAAMRNLGITTIIIQSSKYEDKEGIKTRFYPGSVPGTPDPFESIFQIADATQMKVILGLNLSELWWKNWNNEMWLFNQILTNKALAQTLWTRYGKHASFAGWYIPHEMSDEDFEEYEIRTINYMIKGTAEAARLASGAKTPVYVSTFFKKHLNPADIQSVYTQIFANTKIDGIMVQDGVGENAAYRANIADGTEYVKAFEAAARANKIKTWGIAESFVRNAKNERGPTTADVLEKQIDALDAAQVEHIATFDFFHYLSPNRDREDLTKLHNDYQKLYQARKAAAK